MPSRNVPSDKTRVIPPGWRPLKAETSRTIEAQPEVAVDGGWRKLRPKLRQMPMVYRETCSVFLAAGVLGIIHPAAGGAGAVLFAIWASAPLSKSLTRGRCLRIVWDNAAVLAGIPSGKTRLGRAKARRLFVTFPIEARRGATIDQVVAQVPELQSALRDVLGEYGTIRVDGGRGQFAGTLTARWAAGDMGRRKPTFTFWLDNLQGRETPQAKEPKPQEFTHWVVRMTEPFADWAMGGKRQPTEPVPDEDQVDEAPPRREPRPQEPPQPGPLPRRASRPTATSVAVQMREAGATLQKIADTLTDEGYPIPSGEVKRWHRQQVTRLLDSVVEATAVEG